MNQTVRAYIDHQLARGRHTFTRKEAESATGVSSSATYLALRRLVKQGKLAMPRRGLYLIVDPQHRNLAALPATIWIDDLMRRHGVAYYVGLLSAAALHGAAHQPPQEFQVVAPAILRPLTVGRIRIRFFFRRYMARATTEKMKTSSGYIPVSTPEMTAIDLVRYRRGAGSIDHIATVISELAERIDAQRLLAVATRHDELAVLQRLGYLLDFTGHANLADGMKTLLHDRKIKTVPLEPGSAADVATLDEKWRVLVNASIEIEA